MKKAFIYKQRIIYSSVLEIKSKICSNAGDFYMSLVIKMSLVYNRLY